MDINGREFSELQRYVENYERYLDGLLGDFEKYEMNSLVHPKLQREHLSDRRSIISKKDNLVVLTNNYKLNLIDKPDSELTFNNTSELKRHLLTAEYKNMAIHLEATRQKIVSFVSNITESRAREILGIGEDIYDEPKKDTTKTPAKLLNYASKILGDEFEKHAEDILHQIKNSNICGSDKVAVFLDEKFDNKISFHNMENLKNGMKGLKEAIYKSYGLDSDGYFNPSITEKIGTFLKNVDIVRSDGLTDREIARLKEIGRIRPKMQMNDVKINL